MKLDQLTFTRFLAAIFIVIFHFGRDTHPFNLEPISFLFSQANVGVSYFFILSGFVMIIAYGYKDKIVFAEYIQKRFARIYPVYALATLILALYFILTPSEYLDYKGLILNLTLLQSWIPGKALSFNPAAWSLSTEMFFYLLFPFLFNQFYQKVDFKKIATLIFLFFVLSQFVFHALIYSTFYKGYPSPSHDFLHYFPLMHLNEFLVGNLAGLFFLKQNFRKGNYDLIIISLVILISFLLKSRLGIIYHNGMLAFSFIPIILLISINTGVVTKFLKKKLFVFLGEISYGIYILQFPVFMVGSAVLKTSYFNSIRSPEFIFLINLTILILLSIISYKYIEVPLRKIISNFRLKDLLAKETI